MSTLAVVLIAWFVLSLVLALLLGRAIRSNTRTPQPDRTRPAHARQEPTMTPAEELREAAALLREAAEPLDPRTNDIRLTLPAVAALADWLETTAIKLHTSALPSWQENIEPQAVAVARTILRSQP